LASESGSKAAQRDALDVLTQAQNELGGGPVLDREKRAYLDTVVDANNPLAFSDDGQRTAWEFYALGCTLLRTGQWELASASFQQAVDLDSQAFWPNYYRGVCASRLGRFEDAVAAFSACVTLTPQQPKCFYHRALAYRALGCVDSAARDFSMAQKLDPTLEPPPANLYSLDRRFGER
jgi:tetratricopeptide (TPR) repeat protein